jgi:Flp pilus assembly protein TadB
VLVFNVTVQAVGAFALLFANLLWAPEHNSTPEQTIQSKGTASAAAKQQQQLRSKLTCKV